MTTPAVFTIPPEMPFVDALAAGLRLWLGETSDALAAAHILLPTRRACRSLMLAFVRQAGGRPLLLPRMTPLGDIDEDDVSFDEMNALVSAAGAEIPPAVPALRRQLLLGQHVVRVMGAARTTPAQAAQLAAELGRLFDQVHTERLDLANLDRLVPDELARHWQITLDFLRPIAREWQETLRAEGCIDPADRRQRLLSAQAAVWQSTPPAGPVIAAGSTGSMPATADLLAVIASLPRGAVVLPGLDTNSDEATWRAIDVAADDPDFALAHAHPQFGLAQLLRRLGIDRSAVRPWPASGVGGRPVATGAHPRPRTGPGLAHRGAARNRLRRGRLRAGYTAGSGEPGGGGARRGAVDAAHAGEAGANGGVGHTRSHAGPPRRGRTAALGHRRRQFRRPAAGGNPSRRVPATDRPDGGGEIRTGAAAGGAETPVGSGRPGACSLPPQRPRAGASGAAGAASGAGDRRTA